jgi:two-component system, OmpR family, heavy metal sensor histidine kinase CusS
MFSSSMALADALRTHLRSLAARLTLWYAVSLFLMTAVASIALYAVLGQNLDGVEDQRLGNTVQFVRSTLSQRQYDVKLLQQRFERRRLAGRRPPRQFIRILDAQRHVLVATPGAEKIFDGHPLNEATVDAEVGPGVEFAARGTTFRAVAAWTSIGPSSDDRRLIEVAIDQAVENRVASGYRTGLYVILALSFCCACVVGYAIAKSGMRPVTAMTDAARRIKSSTLGERMPTDRLPTELLSLASTFNQMLERLQDAFTRLSTLSGDLAHELRTPINNMRGEIEVALGSSRTATQYRDALESVLEECVRVAETMNSLLFLARADVAEEVVSRTCIDVGHELESVCEFYEPIALEAGIRLEVNAGGYPVVAALDRTLFQRAVANLVSNAIRHTPAGGRVVIRLHTHGGDLEVSVTDTGAGIPSAHISRVTDRFYRVDQSRSASSGGLGLGLAIVHSIVKVHGGWMDIESEVGQGTTVRLVFPDAGAAASRTLLSANRLSPAS